MRKNQALAKWRQGEQTVGAWLSLANTHSAEMLANAGHEVEVLDEPYSDVMGHAGAALLHQDGTCEGAHDPRADGGAAGA